MSSEAAAKYLTPCTLELGGKVILNIFIAMLTTIHHIIPHKAP